LRLLSHKLYLTAGEQYLKITRCVQASKLQTQRRGSAVPLVIVLLASLPLALLVLGGHKAVGMLLKLAANFRVSRQVLIETRMRCPKLRVVYQLWILRELLSYFRVLIKVAVVEVRHRSCSPAHLSRTITMPPRPLTACTLATAMPLIAALFSPHELSGIVIKLFPNTGMICEESLEARMSAVEIGIFDELGIRGQFLRRLGMVVEVSIEVVYLGRCHAGVVRSLRPRRQYQPTREEQCK
jgi:hypothetical protein